MYPLSPYLLMDRRAYIKHYSRTSPVNVAYKPRKCRAFLKQSRPDARGLHGFDPLHKMGQKINARRTFNALQLAQRNASLIAKCSELHFINAAVTT